MYYRDSNINETFKDKLFKNLYSPGSVLQVFFTKKSGFQNFAENCFDYEIQPCKNEKFIESVSNVAGVNGNNGPTFWLKHGYAE